MHVIVLISMYSNLVNLFVCIQIYQQRQPEPGTSYASAVAQKQDSIQTDSSVDRSERPRKRTSSESEGGTSHRQHSPKRSSTRVVCESPNTGRLYATTVTLDRREDSGENRKKDDTESDNEDLNSYQKELNASKRTSAKKKSSKKK